MFTRTSEGCAIDSVFCAEVKAKNPAGDGSPQLELVMVYTNAKLGITYGTCPLLHQPSAGAEGLLSPQTLEKYRAFVEAAEEDFGRLIFGTGRVTEGVPEDAPQDDDRVATGRPPRFGLGGGRD